MSDQYEYWYGAPCPICGDEGGLLKQAHRKRKLTMIAVCSYECESRPLPIPTECLGLERVEHSRQGIYNYLMENDDALAALNRVPPSIR
jgi:hypothetical protein